MVPGRLTDELLQGLPLLIMQISNRLHILPTHLREQARHVILGVVALPARRQRLGKRLQKAFQARQQPTYQPRSQLGVGLQFFQAYGKTSFHGPFLSKKPFF